MSDELKLDVFISWSGERSKMIAEKLKNWLEIAFQFTRPFLSTEIAAGRRWSEDVAKALDRSNFGILIVTPDNIHSEWLLFEAGALAKHLGESRVVPVLVDMTASDLRPPLSEFQAVRLEDQLYGLAESLNQAQPDSWSAERVRAAFGWTSKQFLVDVRPLVETTRNADAEKTTARPIGEVLEEVLQTVKLLRRSEPSDANEYTDGEQYYPINDRILLYKFLKSRVPLPLYKNASMPALFHAAAQFLQTLRPGLDGEKALSIVAKHLVSERPLQELLEGLLRYDAGGK
jgi:TIR domain